MKAVETPTAPPDVFANVRDSAPDELLSFLDQITLFLPDGVKYRLKQVLDSLPPQGDNLQKVLELVRCQWKDLQTQEWVQIAVVGPAQTGKSSLVGAISERQLVGSEPIFSIVDIRGLDEFLGYRSGDRLHDRLEHADVILLILDGQFELSESTRRLYERLRNLNKPVLVVLNKMDLVEAPGDALRKARKQLGANVFGASAFQPETTELLLKAIVDTDPKTLSPLTQRFPKFRRSICTGIVSQAAFSGAIVGAIPIPVADLLPITAIQTGMLLKIARVFGYELNRERARELLPMLVAGVAVREASHRLRRRYPEYRKLIAVSIAGLWTFLIGQAAISYFENFSKSLHRDSSSDLPSASMGQEIQ